MRLIALIAAFLAVSIVASSGSPRPSYRELYAFPNQTFIENIAVRPNGHLLLGTFDRGRLYTLDPHADQPEAQLVAALPDIASLTGIAEVGPDIFAVSGGNPAANFSFVEGSMKVFTVAFPRDGGPAVVETVANVTNTRSLNGMTTLPGRRHVVLSSDSTDGRILRIDTETGAVDVAFADPSLAPATWETVPLGANGIEALGSDLYFANSGQGFFASVPIRADGSKAGDVRIIARLPGQTSVGHAYDDFGIACGAFAYVGTHANSVSKIDLATGAQQVYFGGGNSTVLKSPTSAAVSRDEKTLYIVTAGVQLDGITAGGQVVEISLP